MCGIIGIFSKKKKNQSIINEINKMAESIHHRGPDDGDTWFNQNYSCVLSHKRLSIVDLSKNGLQPMVSKSKRFVITYNGEIYNSFDLKKLLKSKNIDLKGHSDTEIILELIDCYGIKKILPKLIGMFAFGVFDNLENKIYLCRDRLGKKPLFWSIINNNLIFASELKPFNIFNGFKKLINKNAVANFLRHGYIPAPYSIYEGVFKLEPGSILEISGNDFNPKISKFWDLTGIVKKRTIIKDQTENELINNLDDLLTDSISKRMLADVPLGAFLSGGIDSSTVCAIMQKISSRKIKTFSIGFHENDYNEANHAKKIAQHLKTEHHELYLTPSEAQSFIPEIPKYFDEPFADSSQIPTFLISKMAVEKVKVALSGDGGDELFMGYNRYMIANNVNWIFNLPDFLKKFIINFINLGSKKSWNTLSKIFPNSFVPSQLGEKLYKLTKILKEDDPDFYRFLISSIDNPDNYLIEGNEEKGLVWQNNFDTYLNDYVEKLKLLDTLTYLPDDILTKVDRASMAVSLEVRVPLLDHRIVEFAWCLPKNIQIRKTKTKWILREVLKKYVPENYFNRPKMGFGVPIDSWLRKDLKNWASHLLSDEVFKKYGLLKKNDIQLMWKQHQNYQKNWQNSIWNILMLHSWAQEYL